jgi:hypothetical protein
MVAFLVARRLPAGRLPPACCLLCVLLLDAACCCLVLLPLIAASQLMPAGCTVVIISLGVLLLALGQALLEPLPALRILSACCGSLLVACCLLAEALCKLLSASALLIWHWAA